MSESGDTKINEDPPVSSEPIVEGSTKEKITFDDNFYLEIDNPSVKNESPRKLKAKAKNPKNSIKKNEKNTLEDETHEDLNDPESEGDDGEPKTKREVKKNQERKNPKPSRTKKKADEEESIPELLTDEEKVEEEEVKEKKTLRERKSDKDATTRKNSKAKSNVAEDEGEDSGQDPASDVDEDSSDDSGSESEDDSNEEYDDESDNSKSDSESGSDEDDSDKSDESGSESDDSGSDNSDSEDDSDDDDDPNEGTITDRQFKDYVEESRKPQIMPDQNKASIIPVSKHNWMFEKDGNTFKERYFMASKEDFDDLEFKPILSKYHNLNISDTRNANNSSDRKGSKRDKPRERTDKIYKNITFTFKESGHNKRIAIVEIPVLSLLVPAKYEKIIEKNMSDGKEYARCKIGCPSWLYNAVLEGIDEYLRPLRFESEIRESIFSEQMTYKIEKSISKNKKTKKEEVSMDIVKTHRESYKFVDVSVGLTRDGEKENLEYDVSLEMDDDLAREYGIIKKKVPKNFTLSHMLRNAQKKGTKSFIGSGWVAFKVNIDPIEHEDGKKKKKRSKGKSADISDDDDDEYSSDSEDENIGSGQVILNRGSKEKFVVSTYRVSMLVKSFGVTEVIDGDVITLKPPRKAFKGKVNRYKPGKTDDEDEEVHESKKGKKDKKKDKKKNKKSSKSSDKSKKKSKKYDSDDEDSEEEYDKDLDDSDSEEESDHYSKKNKKGDKKNSKKKVSIDDEEDKKLLKRGEKNKTKEKGSKNLEDKKKKKNRKHEQSDEESDGESEDEKSKKKTKSKKNKEKEESESEDDIPKVKRNKKIENEKKKKKKTSEK